jgi:hypothetical protein
MRTYIDLITNERDKLEQANRTRSERWGPEDENVTGLTQFIDRYCARGPALRGSVKKMHADYMTASHKELTMAAFLNQMKGEGF